jgi:hypothetical protein
MLTVTFDTGSLLPQFPMTSMVTHVEDRLRTAGLS